MGARNIIRTLTEALVAGYQWDTDGQILLVSPEVDNSGTLQINDGTNSMDVKVVLGEAAKHVLFDTSANTIYVNATTVINLSGTDSFFTNTSTVVVNADFRVNLTNGYFLCDKSANTVQCNSDLRVNMSDGYLLADASTNIVQVNGFLQANKTRQRTIISSGTTTLTEDDFGKFIISATNHKHVTLPNPVGNAGATFQFLQVITRNTVLQSVNATAGKFGWDGDNAINTIRINSAGDWIFVVSNDVDWYIGAVSNTQGHITKNVAASF